MGGFFGITSKKDCMLDVFFGVDYHSHLGTRRAGMAAWDEEIGLQRKIHNICNAPFRTKFEHIFEEMRGTSAIGCISDADPQPLLIRSNLGTYAICMTGVINNADELIDQYLSFSGGHFDSMTGGKINQTEQFCRGHPVRPEVHHRHCFHPDPDGQGFHHCRPGPHGPPARGDRQAG